MESTETYNARQPKGKPHPGKFLIGILIIAVLFLIGIIPKILNSRKINSAAKETATAAPEVILAKPRLVAPDDIILPGNVTAILTTSTQARSTGYVSKLYVDIGSHVKAGQLLAEIQSPDVDQQYAQANFQAEQSRATVGESVANVERDKASVLQSRATVLQQRAALVQAVAAREGSKSAKAQAEANLKVNQAKYVQSEQQVLVQQSAYNQAEATFNLGTANYEREKSLLSEGFVSQQDFDTAEATLKTDTAAVKSAQANVDAAKANAEAAQETVSASRQAVRSAQAAEDQAEANVKAANANLEAAIQGLSASKSSLDAGRQTVNANQGALGASVANARRYGVISSFDQVVAPFDGIITARNVDVGSLVSPGAITSSDSTSTTPTAGLFGIAKVDTLRIYVSLPQPDYKWAPSGTKVKVLVRELPKQTFVGTVRQTSGALDTTTRTLLTEVRIPNPKGLLLPGMYAQVEFSSGSEKELRIPSSTIIVDARGSLVIVIDSTNHIHFRKVVLGRDYGTEAEVVSGIQAGDQLVGNASDDMEDGEKVQVIQPKTKTS